VQAQDFVAGCGAAGNSDGRFRYAPTFGKEFDQGSVGFVIDRRRCRADAKPGFASGIRLYSIDRVGLCPWC
jgi:hypothetical protein